MGLKHPEGWPEWLIDAGVRLTQRFGVSRDYERFRPWKAADRHLNRVRLEQYLFGTTYLCVAEKAAKPHFVAGF